MTQSPLAASSLKNLLALVGFSLRFCNQISKNISHANRVGLVWGAPMEQAWWWWKLWVWGEW